MKDKIYYFAKFDLPALLSLSEQRRGQPCTCDVSQMPKSGSLNWVIFVSFKDGIEWVFRSPKSALHTGFYSDETASKILISEASTLLYLKAHTSIPVPEVYAYSGSMDNDIGFQHRHPLMSISNQNREKVISQLGAMMSELSIHPFEKIGSLFDDGNGNYAVGECLSPSLTWQERDSLELDRGPFNEEGDYFISLISAFTSHAQELSLTPHTFFAPVPDMLDYRSLASYQAASRRWNHFVAIGQKIEHSKNILFYNIAGQFLSEMIPYLSSSVRNGFTLSHPDLHLGNVYIDDDFNITCIIDWSSASTGPVSELLAAPSLGNSAAPPSNCLIAAYRSGFSQRAPGLLHSDLWLTSERMWYFTRITRLLSKNDHQLFERLFELIYKTSTDDNGREGILWLFHQRANRNENRKLLAELQEADLTSEELQERERACFPPSRTVNSDAIAVARKLTLMSEMNPAFLADHRLWQWVEEARVQDEHP
ncbi:hypothetical protein NM208_g5564 [Fusarium decemcellulare]|uniref:Uncharacterized protein n=1 Tax=Fusarium decemcellulare TaxID=57161 RepID=A0ACC1SGG8_9HYPO|nr:hypothetical protein NM208_g5564 [Fusarium decemcellulare]